MDIQIEVRFNPPDLIQRFERFPDKLREEMETTMEKALYHTQGSIPPYPPARPESSYVRTGTLGRSIGLGGRADIYEVKRIGSGYEARLGTRLTYAPHVISSEQQAWMHQGRWWTMKTVAEKAKPGIIRLFQAMTERLAAYLEGNR